LKPHNDKGFLILHIHAAMAKKIFSLIIRSRKHKTKTQKKTKPKNEKRQKIKTKNKDKK
jgi:hypothetical protein